VQVHGPLEAYAGRFRQELSRLGYSSSSAAGHLQLMAHLSRWLADIGLDPGELTVARAERFVEHRRASFRVHRCLTLRGMGPLLDHLREVGVVPAPESWAALGRREQLIEEFTGYLIAERGLAVSTVGNYRNVADRFLTGCCWESDDLVGVSGESVNVFVLGEAARRGCGSLNNVTTGLRALLRFLYMHGDTPTQLVGAVPVAPGWRDRGFVRAVAPVQVARMLGGCDRRTAIGRPGVGLCAR
jgi:integrase/recombinase XerD